MPETATTTTTTTTTNGDDMTASLYILKIDRSGGSMWGYSPDRVHYFADARHADRIARIARRILSDDTDVRVVQRPLRTP